MKGTGAGWDSILYRVYIIGGLVGIVAVTIITSVFLDPQRSHGPSRVVGNQQVSTGCIRGQMARGGAPGGLPIQE